MKNRMLIVMAIAVLMVSCVTIPADGEKWINLLEDGMTAWQDSGGWKTADEVIMDPADENQLKITKEGKSIAVVPARKDRGCYLLSREQHADVEAVIEFMVPKGSNSGIYFMGRYEIQVFDSYGREKVGHSDCGGIYQRWGQNRDEGRPPRVNASTAPGTWQKYEVTFRAPRFDADGRKTENAKFVKVVHNGKVIHEDAEVTGPTRSAMKETEPEEATGPIRIQGDHGPVAYKTVRIRHINLK